jgi:hypothetical protein
LRLRDNPHDFKRSLLTSFISTPNNQGTYLTFAASNRNLDAPPEWSPLYNVAYGKLRGKLYKDSASLGVTLGSFGQSSAMILKRLGQVKTLLDLSIRRYTSNRSYLKARKRLLQDDIRNGREAAANVILEANFGWKPLIQDIGNSFHQLAGQPATPRWVKGKEEVPINTSVPDRSSAGTTLTTRTGWARVTMGASVTVSNPNLWMLNKLGLLNPVAVAWDLVPWSFVVNMFINVNTLINSLTDFIGLSFGSVNVTRSALITRTYTENFDPKTYSPFTQRVDVYKIRLRSVYSEPPRPTIQFRTPEMNRDLLIIAGSLVIQRFRKLNDLLGFPPF